MRVLVFEYITGGGRLDASLPASLAREGELMLQALAKDLAELPQIDIFITRDARLSRFDGVKEVHYVKTPEEFSRLWGALLQDVDAVWPIAPETGGTLEKVSQSVIDAGKILLNSRPQAVSIAASKYQTARLLEDEGVPVVPTYRPHDELPNRMGKWIVKPDDGVGCEGIRICIDFDELYSGLRALRQDRFYVVQPYTEDLPVSMSLLCWDGRARVLSCNVQRVAIDQTVHLLGCVVNGYQGDRERYDHLAHRIAAALPGLWGYVGVDLLDAEKGPYVLEVNPRLTTSYAGLHSAIGTNPASMVLDLLNEQNQFAHGPLEKRRVDVELELAHVE